MTELTDSNHGLLIDESNGLLKVSIFNTIALRNPDGTWNISRPSHSSWKDKIITVRPHARYRKMIRMVLNGAALKNHHSRVILSEYAAIKLFIDGVIGAVDLKSAINSTDEISLTIGFLGGASCIIRPLDHCIRAINTVRID